MQLEMLVRNISREAITGSTKVEIESLCYDSRRASEGALFFALRGESVDGHAFITRAIEGGARAVVAEEPPEADFAATWIKVKDSRVAMADAARFFYGDPAAAMAMIGITGTNGKTTTAFLLHHLLKSTWKRCGLIGTVLYDTGETQLKAERTTPESLDLQRLLARMRDEGCRAAVMEVSSHGLLQERVRGVEFDVAIFTNLSQDHLDYHGSMDSYFAAKERLFEGLPAQKGEKSPAIVVNRDDSYGHRLLRKFGDKLPVVSFGLGVGCDFHASDVRSDLNGTTFRLEAKKRSFFVRLPLVGRFNVYNALGALAAGSALDINLRESVRNLAEAPQVPGRLQSVAGMCPFKVFVDYAHTPDALENVLEALRKVSSRRVITVFGCGGDRDREKRPLMGRAAERLSDFVIVTSDNPRSEDPGHIIEDIERGMPAKRHRVVVDRREAISEAIAMAGHGDIVLLAGKGHETTQQIGDRKVEFDDVQMARHCIEGRGESL